MNSVLELELYDSDLFFIMGSILWSLAGEMLWLFTKNFILPGTLLSLIGIGFSLALQGFRQKKKNKKFVWNTCGFCDLCNCYAKRFYKEQESS